MSAERTQQRLDPLGAYSARTLPVGCAVLMVGYAAVSSAVQAHQVRSPAATVVAIVLIVTAALALVVATRPRFAPLTRGSFLLALGLTLAASLADAVSTWGRNELIQDDWGQVVVALALIAVAQLRPWREIVVASIVAAVILGGAAFAQASFLAVQVGPLVYALVAAVPVLALGMASAVFGRIMLVASERWQRSATEAMRSMHPEIRDAVVRQVQQDEVTELNRCAVPLITGVLEREALTRDDIAAAAAIGAELRQYAIDALTRDWLRDVLERAGVAATVDAEQGVVDAVTSDQRAVVGAFLVALTVECGAAGAPELTLRRRGHDLATLTVDARVQASDHDARGALTPYLAVLRTVSHHATLAVKHGAVRLEFEYDCD
jgi:hypothetical protein